MAAGGPPPRGFLNRTPCRKGLASWRSVCDVAVRDTLFVSGNCRAVLEELRFQVLAKTQAVAVAILDVKVAAAVKLVFKLPHDLHTFGLELGVERVSVVDPNVRVPRDILWISDTVRAHQTCLFKLLEHHGDAVAAHH